MSLTLPIEEMVRLRMSVRLGTDGRLTLNMQPILPSVAPSSSSSGRLQSNLKLHFNGTADATGTLCLDIWAEDDVPFSSTSSVLTPSTTDSGQSKLTSFKFARPLMHVISDRTCTTTSNATVRCCCRNDAFRSVDFLIWIWLWASLRPLELLPIKPGRSVGEPVVRPKYCRHRHDGYSVLRTYVVTVEYAMAITVRHDS